MKILLTGFKSTENITNASNILVDSLSKYLPEELKEFTCDLEFRIIIGNTHTINEELSELLNSIKPSYCIFIGQAPGYNKVTLELIATNYRFIGPPLKVGDAPQGCKIELNGPAAYMATLPDISKIIDVIKEEKIPAGISYNGGNSLCNQILYHGLHYATENDASVRCGFLHIPALPEQVISQWPQHPFMPLEMSRKVVELIVKILFQSHESIITQ